MKTVLITGTSSGYGLEMAKLFHAEGWKVIAGMRTPREDVLPESDRIQIVPLDVTSPDSIKAALEAAGLIDVLVNNAGIGMFGAFEATSIDTARQIFETNTFGVMAMTQAVIPQFRARGSGTIINITSSAVLVPMPLVAIYTASKTAVDGFTASLANELNHFGIRVKMVQPGYGPTTAFSRDAASYVERFIPEAYQAYANDIFGMMTRPKAHTLPEDVAKVVWQAAHDNSAVMSFPAGPDAVEMSKVRRAA
ncbi:SDR family oxidoreductase [Mesorhizobium intechi]|uniref:SDR family oxidoreductase n=1 Tax=Mesorhizobium intechi TaxID=537601 RepID=UPI000CA97AB9|nr:SDR family oxidoreductase [Mesorhizobium intechi]TSE05298.1 SDR family oxidoreductase [Mesorhizobium intechi]